MRRFIATNRRILIIAGLLLALLAGIIGIREWLFVDLPDVNDLSGGLHTPSIRITDRHGRPLYEVIGTEEGRNTVVPLEAIPQACLDATIATEDANFYTNSGVDFGAILRSLWINFRGGEVVSGASTITQQVARNTLLDPQERSERTLTRKLREGILAYRLTRRYSKDEILALYLNQTYYGNLAYGIDAAARAYFGKPAASLDLAECALLAGLPQAPGLYDPLTDPEAAQARQEVVLDLMVEKGYLDEQTAELARKEPLSFASERYAIDAPHFVAAVYNRLERMLPPEVFYAGGLEVRTTLDLDWQHSAEEIARRHIELLNKPQPDDPPHNASNAALVALDPQTGQVYVMMGSLDYFDAGISGAVNMALAPRQPGSALKPFTYAASFDPTRDEPLTAATMLLDVRTSFVTRGGVSYAPVNYDRQEHGPVLAREALASSYNIPAVIVLNEIGITSLFDLLARLGVSTFVTPENYDLALTLGGGDVRLLELTAVYGALANGGYRVDPVLILEVTNAQGEVIYQAESGVAGEAPVIDPRVAWLIGDILSDNNARAPVFTSHSILQIGRPAAAKTGTTTDFRDNWTLGYTPDLVVGVWVGNTDNDSMTSISGVSGAGPIWHHFMREVLKGTPEHWFEQPEGLVQVEVCSLSGLLPTEVCPYTRLEWFIRGTEPTDYDTFYKKVWFDAATGLPATDDTPAEQLESRVYLDLPPQAHDWARRKNLPLLPDSFAATGDHGWEGLAIVAPDANNVYEVTAGLPLDGQKIRIVAVGPPGVHTVTIYLDGLPLATIAGPPFETWWPPEVGVHEVYAEGYTAAGEVIRSGAIWFQVDPPD